MRQSLIISGTVLALVIGLGSGSAKADCTLRQRGDFAKAGYTKAEIEGMCAGKSGEAGKASAPSPKPTPSTSGKAPGTVFRDCADCPEMVVVPAGSFLMGSNDADSDEIPVHQVSIPRAFAVGKYEVTQGEWQAVMGNNPSYFPGSRNPVEQVSWEDVQDFIRRLNQKTGQTYRLLSEAEWEYAARAGTGTKYPWGDSIGSGNANCYGCGSQWDNRQTAPVGQFRPNAFGLYDMHGNVWEWTQDCWNGSYSGAPGSGSAWTSGDCTLRVLRGGSWGHLPSSLRSAIRNGITPGNRNSIFGFRLARTL